MRIATGAETQPIVEALIEHAERCDLGARRGLTGKRMSRQPFRRPQFAGDTARGNGQDSGQRQVRPEITHAARCGEHRAFGLAVERKNHAIKARSQTFKRFGVVLVV